MRTRNLARGSIPWLDSGAKFVLPSLTMRFHNAAIPTATAVALVWLCPAAALAQFGGAPVSVVTAPVERRPVRLTQPLVASVEPVTRTTLAAEQPGLVAERSFDEGQRIEKGQVLARMKTDTLEAMRDAAEAARVSAEASVARAEAEAALAAARAKRMQRLAASNAGNEDELSLALTTEKTAAAEVNVRKATLAEKSADVERLTLMIEESKVVSPIAGVVSKRNVEVGQWVKQGDPVADVVQFDPLFVRVNVPEEVIARVQPGDEARVTIDALGGKQFVGKVDQVLPEADPGSRTFAVKILLPNPDHRIRPGFFARASLTSSSDAALVVPRDAVVTRAGGEAHVVVLREGKAVVVPVTRGPAEGEKTVVVPTTEGALKADDQVVVRGNEALRGGEMLMAAGGPPPGGGGGTAKGGGGG